MPIFPLKQKPKQDYKTRPRGFGCPRDGGKRKHAGCDLYAPVGTPILSVEDGEVVLGPYLFYLGTYALEVKHADGKVVRYGEIQKAADGIKVGSKVKAGQVIAYVGKLKGLNISMIHFELFSGTAKGPLTNRADKSGYSRRADLVNPTAYLDSCTLTTTV